MKILPYVVRHVKITLFFQNRARNKSLRRAAVQIAWLSMESPNVIVILDSNSKVDSVSMLMSAMKENVLEFLNFLKSIAIDWKF